MKRNYWFIMICTLILGASCSKELVVPATVGEISKIDFYSCHQEETWTLAKVESRLIGEWSWRASYNPWLNEFEGETEEGIILSFNENKDLNVFRGEVLLRTVTWQIGNVTSDAFTLSTEPYEPLANGQLLICDDLFSVVNSFVDGIDHFFQFADD